MLRMIWIGGVTFFFLMAWLKTKSAEKIAMMASWDPELKGRDERERSIILAATERTYITGVFLLLLSAMVIFVVPSPSALAVSDLLFAISMVFAGLRNFFAWQLGLK